MFFIQARVKMHLRFWKLIKISALNISGRKILLLEVDCNGLEETTEIRPTFRAFVKWIYHGSNKVTRRLRLLTFTLQKGNFKWPFQERSNLNYNQIVKRVA